MEPTTSRVDTVIAEMREYRSHLESELRQVQLMLNAVDGVQPRVNTAEMLLELFEEDPSREFTAAEAEELLTARGWSTESKDKVNAVRASLVRLKNAGDLESVGRGTYRLHRDQSDDPWGNAPIRTSEADDEPPF